jgi:hypothetical protein
MDVEEARDVLFVDEIELAAPDDDNIAVGEASAAKRPDDG